MNIKSKFIWYITSTFILLGFVGLVLRLLQKVITGHGNDYYISGMGYQLTAIGVLALLSILPAVGFIAWYLNYRQNAIERDFIKKYGKNNKST